MRAHKGDEIVCKCGQPAGFFDRDVEDRASISSSHIVLTAPLAPDDPHCHVCSVCDEPVVHFLGDRWRVRARNGWLE